MITSCCFICVFAVLINEVCLQVTVKGGIGDFVVLPCLSTQHDHKLQDISVHWRYSDIKIVYDIVEGEDSVAFQDPKYKNRAETFPKEYQRGNFSMKLTSLTHADAGKYVCLIAHSSELLTVQLNINDAESPAEKERYLDEQDDSKAERRIDSMGTSLYQHLHCIICIVSAALIIVLIA